MPHVIEPKPIYDHAYFQRAAALLEPDAIEYARLGTFTYAIGSNETKYVLLARDVYFDPNTSARYDVRNPTNSLPLRGVTVKGSSSSSAAIFLNSSTPSYADGRQTYYDRMNQLARLTMKSLHLSGLPTLFLPGPYGSVVKSLVTFNSTDVGLGMVGHTGNHFALNYSHPSATSRFSRTMLLPITKAYVQALRGNGTMAITYVNLPATWSAVQDTLSPYQFRDDFMGSSVDTATKWTRAQSTVGNVEIDTRFNWVKLIGNNSWGGNGMFGQTGYARSAQRTLLMDVNVTTTNFVIGWHDGAGHSYADFAHGLDFTNGNLQIFENGTSRGTVGSGYGAGHTYRVRIRALSGGGATYEIQGGTQYNPIGSGTWNNITPGTSTSATATLHPGVTIQDAGTGSYVGDVRIY